MYFSALNFISIKMFSKIFKMEELFIQSQPILMCNNYYIQKLFIVTWYISTGFLRSGKTWKSQGISKFLKSQGKVREFQNNLKIGEFFKIFKSFWKYLKVWKISKLHRKTRKLHMNWESVSLSNIPHE